MNKEILFSITEMDAAVSNVVGPLMEATEFRDFVGLRLRRSPKELTNIVVNKYTHLLEIYNCGHYT